MATERDKISFSVKPVEYNVGGNAFRAFYGAGHRLLFVIDDTITPDKPNVMLVMDPVPGRKWDDILSNDYGVDLEIVRPRRDNKYQKLDIEYGGLDVYADLIDAADGNGDVTAALNALVRFRIDSSRRAATERLAAATDAADKSQETVARTNETISGLQSQIRELRAKLKKQRSAIGREPTKQSAAKILRSEAQIDAANEKLARAKKRLVSAQRRLASAEEDAQIAREILARNPVYNEIAPAGDGYDDAPTNVGPVVPAAPVAVPEITAADEMSLPDNDDDNVDDAYYDADTLPAAPMFTDVALFKSDDADTVADNDDEDTIIENEPRTEDMADEKEVKPLFDTDPEILDDEIAFKPIDFEVRTTPAPAPRATEPVADADEVIAPSPLSFVPPTRQVAPQPSAPADETYAPRDTAPVLDSITSVDVQNGNETVVTETFTPQPAPQAQPNYQSVAAPAPAPQDVVAPAPVSSPVRPVSPIKRDEKYSAPVEPNAKKPALVYYIMLIILIALSIFTLWIYQKSTRDTTPDLAAPAPAQQIQSKPEMDDTDEPNPFLVQDQDTVESVQIIETETVDMTPVVESEPEPIPVIAMPEPDPEPIPVQPVVIEEDIDSPFIPVPERYEPEKPVVPTEEEVLASKPAYNVSQQEKMFVADQNYDTDVVYSNDSDDIEYFNTINPVDYVANPVELSDGEVASCSNGASPDLYGCCPGETYTDMGDGFACCSADECYPPMF